MLSSDNDKDFMGSHEIIVLRTGEGKRTLERVALFLNIVNSRGDMEIFMS